jgi:hypothetical protein
MSDTATFRTPTTKRFPRWSMTGYAAARTNTCRIAFRTACIPETHRQRYSIKADQPNQRAQ